MSDNKNMTLKLKIWRQKSATDKGEMVDYTLDGVSPDQSFLEMMDTIEEKNPGFYLVGNFRTGISLDACIRHSWNHPLTQTHPAP
jgi:hypothetical protein